MPQTGTNAAILRKTSFYTACAQSGPITNLAVNLAVVTVTGHNS